MKTNGTNLLKKLFVLSLALAAAAPLCAMEGAADADGGGGDAAAAGAAEAVAVAVRIEENRGLIQRFRAYAALGFPGVHVDQILALPNGLPTLAELSFLKAYLCKGNVGVLSEVEVVAILANFTQRLIKLYGIYACGTPQDCLFAIAGRGYPAAAAAAAVPGGSAMGLTTAVRLLVLAGADVNARYVGFTPLHVAAECGHAAVLRALLAAGADVNYRDSFGSTPLQRAARQGHADVVRELLAAGATICWDAQVSRQIKFIFLKEQAKRAARAAAPVVAATASVGAAAAVAYYVYHARRVQGG